MSGTCLTVTGTTGRREEKRRQTRERIFDEAMRLFRERGFDSVAVGEIARAAGVSVPTFYAHFESKDHLILVLPTQQEIQQLVGSFPAELSTVELLRGVMLRVLEDGGGVDAPDRILHRWRVIAASAGLRHRAAEFERATADLIVRALPEDRSNSPEAQVTVTALMSAYTHVLLRWAESDGKRAPEELVDEVLAALRDLSP